ncbi:hypothetical protein RBH29_02415 [Herbivorax sp. ANBcel31]|uniref:hypothetical protein n=1 Tax=Herbivorax sp. ANBcel31 TaxID=3069754 RepID=UPI0027B70805|nr:hypothetical protein [Herbivorax sp. ANBcel31]MDQ2085290.1 hypothetical protein [Herbivorax sp. ANBcel31]
MNKLLKNKKIVVLIVFVMVFAFYYIGVYRKQMLEIELLRDTISTYDEISKSNQDVAKRAKNIDGELKIINEKMEKIRKIFPPKIIQDELLIMVKNTANDSGMTIDRIRFFEIEMAEKIEESNFKNELSKNTIQSENMLNALEDMGFSFNAMDLEREIPDGYGFLLRVNISAIGTNSNIKNFLSNVNEIKNKIVVEELKIDAVDGEKLTCNFNLLFYGIMDKKAAEKRSYMDLSWTPKRPSNRDNIFIIDDNLDVENNIQTREYEVDKYDFTMKVNPYGENMSPPTVSLVLKNLETGYGGIPVVYGDSIDKERIYIYIEEKDGQYLSRFKTELDSFPSGESGELAVFEPEGDRLNMLINSTRRISEEDHSKVNVSIENNTDKDFIIEVINDDKNRPRVIINEITDNVIINKH